MSSLVLSGLLWVAVCLSIADTNVRRALSRQVGARAENALIGLAAFAALLLLATRYSAAFASNNAYFWYLGDVPQRLAAPVMMVALFFAVSGLLTAKPRWSRPADATLLQPVRGVRRITRHPVLWGIVTWSSFHMFANGDAASLVFFGSFFVGSFAVMWLIERQRANPDADFERMVEQTSVVPFVAIARGKNRLVWREFKGKQLLLVLLVFSVIVSFHPRLFGAYPLPGMDD